MIYTRFGSEVKSVTWFDEETGEIGAIVITAEGGVERAINAHISNFKADGGVNEIIAAAKQIRNPVKAD
jgi:hypothetical protein